MVRVAGTDPGTSSLDVITLLDGKVEDQVRFTPEEIRADPSVPVHWLTEQGPFDLIAGPSGYGLPIVRAQECVDHDLSLMALVRPDDVGPGRQGVLGFTAVLQAFRQSSLPVFFLPGVIHLGTVPSYRKMNRIDLGTADKLCVAALALDRYAAQFNLDLETCSFCVVEIGTAFTSCMVVQDGRIIDGLGGSSGPCGWRSGGAWDGEAAYLLSPLAKQDLFAGGVLSGRRVAPARLAFRESLIRAVAGLRALAPFEIIIMSGRLLEIEPEFAEELQADLGKLTAVWRLRSLPGAWVKQAAQGGALIADGLAGGSRARLVEQLELRQAGGTCLDWLEYPGAQQLRAAFGITT